MNITHIRLLALLLVFCSPAGIALPEGFKPAELQESFSPAYPQQRFSGKSKRASEDSGVVELTYMIDTQGKPFEIAVLRSTMAKFEDAAIKAIQRYKFQPAMLGSAPISTRYTSDVVFRYSARDAQSASGATASRRDLLDIETPYTFDTYYEQFSNELAKPDPRQSHAAHLINKMARLEDQTFLSIVYTATARSRFADAFLEPSQRILAYQNLIWLNDRISERYQPLSGDVESVVWSQMIGLQIESGLFAEALAGYAAAQQNEIELDSAVADHRSKLLALREDREKVTRRAIEIGAGGQQLLLFKPSFEISNVAGKITSLKLRCDTKFKEMEFKPDANYGIPDSWGGCALQISGDKGTTAELLEN